MEHVAFLAPHENSTFGFVATDGVYRPYIDLEVPAITRSIRHAGCLIFVCRFDPVVHFFDLASGKRWTISLPAKSRPFDLVVWRNWLFVAAGGRTLLATDAWKAGASWATLPCVDAAWARPPRENAAWLTLPCEKDIDALAVQDDRLLALDNIVMPKWLLIFDLTDAGALGPSRVQLPDHGTYETIEAAAYWNGRFAVLSRSVGMLGVCKYVWLLDGSSYGQVGSAYSFQASFDPRNDEGFLPLICAEDVAACRDILVLAGGRYGLVATSLDAEAHATAKSVRSNYQGLLANDFRQFWPAAARYRPIVCVRACDDPAGFIVTSIEGRRLRRERSWEEALVRKRVRAVSYFLSYDEMKQHLERMPPGRAEGTKWRDKTRRAELRRDAGRASGWIEAQVLDRSATGKK